MKILLMLGFLVYATSSFANTFNELEFQRMEERVHEVLKGSQALRTDSQSEVRRAPASMSEEEQKFFDETENIDKD